MHDKGLIVDSKFLISGGRNIGDGYFGRYSKTDSGETLPIFEDSDVLVLESKAVNDAAGYFDDLWNSKFVSIPRLYDYSKEQLASDYCRYQENGRDNDTLECESRQKYYIKEVLDEEKKFEKFIITYKTQQAEAQYYALDWAAQGIIVSNVEFLHDDVKTQKSNLDKPEKNVAARLYEVISNAKKHVIIVSPYLVITPEHEALFKKLKEKNVKVQIFTNSKASNDGPAAYVGYEKSRHIALNQGAEIYEYQGPDTLHAKMVFVDDQTLFIGSYNWDYRSQNLNREVGILATLPENPEHHLNVEIFDKISRIIRNSCRTDGSSCVPTSNIRLADVTEEQMQRLIELNKRREEKSSKVFRIFYSIIKEQL
ncbi:MAG: phospholipase D-like domain-containing protein [Pseudobdellovibrio sp.]